MPVTTDALPPQHHELAGDRPVPDWNGGHDHAAHSAQGHRQIQPDRLCGKVHHSVCCIERLQKKVK